MSQYFRTNLAHYLGAAGLGLTVGTNLFRGQIPATIAPTTLVVLLALTGGRQSLQYLATRPTVQITVRSSDLDAAEAKAWAIHDLLNDPAAPILMGSSNKSRVATCKALQPPFVLPGLDERQAWRVVCNYEFTLSTEP